MKKIIRKFKTMRPRNRAIVLFVMLMLTIGSAYSVWVISITGNSVLVVESTQDNPLILVSNFQGSTLNTMNDSVNFTDILTFRNDNGDISLNFSNELIVTDVDDDCNPEGDITQHIIVDSNGWYSPQVLSPGEHTITIETGLKRFSCPATYENVITIVASTSVAT